MAKQLLFDDKARQAMLRGVEQLADTVAVTMGPTGRNVIMNKSYGGPQVTKDGITVAKEIELEDPFENMGAKLVNEVAQKTADLAGDGTTTATILARAIFKEGLRNIAAGSNPTAIRRGIDKAVQAAVEYLYSIGKKVTKKEEIANVGTISANNDREIGNLLAEAMEKVGNDGVITLEESKTAETFYEIVEGMQFDKGFLSPYFITNPDTMACEMENAMVLLHEKKISNLRDMLPLLEKVVSSGKPLLIIAEDIDGEALTALVVNRLKGILNVCAVKAPGFGDRRKAMLQDIGIMTGGTVISEDLGVKLENVTLEMLGSVKQATITKDSITRIGGAGKKADVKKRIDQLREMIEHTDSNYDREKYQERLAKLSGGVAVIKVGANTEAEMKQKKDRVDDALSATRAAVAEGIVPGGGVAYIRCLDVLDKMEGANADETTGIHIVRRAIEEPLRQIVDNAGLEGAVVVQKVREGEGDFGYNAYTDKYENLFETGVIDPAKVARVALQNAASIAGMFLTTECVIAEKKEENPMPAGNPGMGGMGGMM